MKPCIYILASRRNGSLYIGMTTDIGRRLAEHHAGLARHTREYRIRRLVYLEFHDTIEGALVSERRLTVWKRAWKICLIEGVNPQWNDLRRDLAEID